MAQLINREENLQKVPEQVGPSVKLQMKWMELVACRHPSLSSSISRKAAMHPTRRGTRDDVGRRFLKTALHKLLGLSVQRFSSKVYEDPELNAATPGDLHADRPRIGPISSYRPNPVRSPVRKALARYTCRPLHPARCPFGPGPAVAVVGLDGCVINVDGSGTSVRPGRCVRALHQCGKNGEINDITDVAVRARPRVLVRFRDAWPASDACTVVNNGNVRRAALRPALRELMTTASGWPSTVDAHARWPQGSPRARDPRPKSPVMRGRGGPH
uniref:Uncharacterized protein n=1 Tax=Oryza meridionalis TaxID=40149 RepID=A0A0E0DGL4_9ORYZ